MSERYQQLLDATLAHLEELKERGERFVMVAPETLVALAQPVPRMALAAARPAASGSMPRDRASMTVSPRPAPKPAAALPASSSATTVLPADSSLTTSTLFAMPATAPLPAAATFSSSPLDPAAKVAAMAQLRERVLACVKCPPLVNSRQTVVFGVGSSQAQLMFVGEAPGADEDVQGEPFVGRAGQLLTKIIQTMGLSRETVYIGNILKCRPDTPGQPSGNRKPTPAEMQTCLPHLLAQIEVIRPRVLVALGATAVEGLLGRTVGITKLRGTWQTFRGIPLMPTYHPAYLLRNQALAEKRKVWEDMLKVMEKLEMPISPKQRKYFLKASP